MKRMEGPTGLTIDEPTREELEDVVVRFAGASGDGVQITGGQFTLAPALAGNFLLRSGHPPAQHLEYLHFKSILDPVKFERWGITPMF